MTLVVLLQNIDFSTYKSTITFLANFDFFLTILQLDSRKIVTFFRCFYNLILINFFTFFIILQFYCKKIYYLFIYFSFLWWPYLRKTSKGKKAKRC